MQVASERESRVRVQRVLDAKSASMRDARRDADSEIASAKGDADALRARLGEIGAENASLRREGDALKASLAEMRNEMDSILGARDALEAKRDSLMSLLQDAQVHSLVDSVQITCVHAPFYRIFKCIQRISTSMLHVYLVNVSVGSSPYSFDLLVRSHIICMYVCIHVSM
jgi:regulator of replication initiation timing